MMAVVKYLIICHFPLGVKVVVIFFQVRGPGAFDVREHRDDFLIRQNALVRRHAVLDGSVWLRRSELGYIEQKLIGVMPGVAAHVMRRCAAPAVRFGSAPVLLSFKISPMTGCAIGLVNLFALLNDFVTVRRQLERAHRRQLPRRKNECGDQPESKVLGKTSQQLHGVLSLFRFTSGHLDGLATWQIHLVAIHV